MVDDDFGALAERQKVGHLLCCDMSGVSAAHERMEATIAAPLSSLDRRVSRTSSHVRSPCTFTSISALDFSRTRTYSFEAHDFRESSCGRKIAIYLLVHVREKLHVRRCSQTGRLLRVRIRLPHQWNFRLSWTQESGQDHLRRLGYFAPYIMIPTAYGRPCGHLIRILWNQRHMCVQPAFNRLRKPVNVGTNTCTISCKLIKFSITDRG